MLWTTVLQSYAASPLGFLLLLAVYCALELQKEQLRCSCLDREDRERTAQLLIEVWSEEKSN